MTTVREIEKRHVAGREIEIIDLYRSQQTIQKWRYALSRAENDKVRTKLYELYWELMFDIGLLPYILKRKRLTTNIEVEIVHPTKDFSEISRNFEKSEWFEDLKNEIYYSIFWGHSLLELKVNDKGLQNVVLIPRQNVSPEKELIYINKDIRNTEKAIKYKEEKHKPYFFEVGKSKDLGLLNVATVNVLFGKQSKINLSDLVQIFGKPVREFQYQDGNEQSKEETRDSAKRSGGSTIVIHPKSSSFKMHNGIENGNVSMHLGFSKILKEELRFLITGIENTGESYKHEENRILEQSHLVQEDRKMMLRNLDKFLKLLNEHGYDFEGCSFQFKEKTELSLQDRLKIDLELKTKAGLEFPEDYFYNTYGIPKPTKKGNEKDETKDI